LHFIVRAVTKPHDIWHYFACTRQTEDNTCKKAGNGHIHKW
jgi:hypothetical protein